MLFAHKKIKKRLKNKKLKHLFYTVTDLPLLTKLGEYILGHSTSKNIEFGFFQIIRHNENLLTT